VPAALVADDTPSFLFHLPYISLQGHIALGLTVAVRRRIPFSSDNFSDLCLIFLRLIRQGFGLDRLTYGPRLSARILAPSGITLATQQF
jgi:hypothetical protein